MRLYVLELKRLLKTRSVSFLLIAALVLSAVMAYVPVTYIQAYKTDKSGNIEAVSGREAIKVKRADKKALQGEMTEAKLRETITDIKEVLKDAFLRKANLKQCYATCFLASIICYYPKSPYLCNVFFIVLDLRLTKVGARRCSFFILSPLLLR